jgi:hypothetical protein
MPRFYFHVYNGHGDTPDEVGSDLEDQAAARLRRSSIGRCLSPACARRGVIDLKGRIDVLDGSDNVLVIVQFAEAFDLRMPDGTRL